MEDLIIYKEKIKERLNNTKDNLSNVSKQSTNNKSKSREEKLDDVLHTLIPRDYIDEESYITKLTLFILLIIFGIIIIFLTLSFLFSTSVFAISYSLFLMLSIFVVIFVTSIFVGLYMISTIF